MPVSRFSSKILPFLSKYEPSSSNPLDRDSVQVCDLCDDRRAKFKSPKVKFVWCASCDEEVKEGLNLTEDDISYV
jgi:hypothetical protein